MPYKVYFKKKGNKKWKTNKSLYLSRAKASRGLKALREKKTHNTRIGYVSPQFKNTKRGHGHYYLR